MNSIEILLSNVEGFTFSKRPNPLPSDLRLLWKIPMLLLILSFCKDNKSSLTMLHVLNWVIKTPENRRRFYSHITGEENKEIIIARFEPSMNLALDFAKGEGLIEFISGKYIKLTDKGAKITTSVNEYPNFFIEERDFLSNIKPYIKESKINALFEGRYL